MSTDASAPQRSLRRDEQHGEQHHGEMTSTTESNLVVGDHVAVVLFPIPRIPTCHALRSAPKVRALLALMLVLPLRLCIRYHVGTRALRLYIFIVEHK